MAILAITVALLLGVISGTITGLFPGIHINLISALFLSSPILLSLNPFSAATFVVSMSITHTFLDFIPSILLGAPEEDSFLSILPGHQLLKQGQGFQAIVYTLYGSLIAIILSTLLSPLVLLALPKIYSTIQSSIPYILIFFSLFLIFKEEKIFSAFFIFLLSGLLGLLTFNIPVKEPFLPLLTGLFGLSTLLFSLKSKYPIPEQKISPLRNLRLSKKRTFKATLSALLVAPFAAFLPGFGSGHAALISSQISNLENKPKYFLYLLGMINTIIMPVSFLALYSINRTRTGSALALSEILTLTPKTLATLILLSLVTGLSVFFLGILLARISVKVVNKIPYKTLSLFVILILLAVNTFLTNFLGFLVLLTSTSLGMFCLFSETKRINLLGSLIIPTILFYLT